MTDFKVLAVIAARGGSKGIPNKNIAPLGDKPLLTYMIEAAHGAKSLSKVILSTDSERIADIGRTHGVEVPFLRPSGIAQDLSTLMEVNQHAVRFYEERGETFDAVMSLQPTAPFLKSATIDKAVEMLRATNCDSVTSIAQLTQCHPQIMKKFENDGAITNYLEIPPGELASSRQERKPVYFLTGSFYLRPTELLMAHEGSGHALGRDSRACLLDEIEATDINTLLDFTIAECLLDRGLVS